MTATGGSATVEAVHNGYAGAYVEAAGIRADGNVDNSGAITVTAIGGSVAGQNSFAYTNATGINSSGSMGPSLELVGESPTEDVTSIVNTGAITVTATGGTAEGQYSSADARAAGIGSSDSEYRSDKSMLISKSKVAIDVINTGAITVTATGGTANGEQSSVDADAVGIYTSGNVSNSGAITVTATGGTAEGQYSSADARAAGIGSSGGKDLRVLTVLMEQPEVAIDVINSGAITVTATGGTANGEQSSADADAVGIYTSGNVSNSGAITVTATGGSATAEAVFDSEGGWLDAYTDVEATGIGADGNVDNSGAITVTATGGSSTAFATMDDKSASKAWIGVNAYVEATGIGADGNVNNSGAITVTATGGSANAEAAIDDESTFNSYAEAYVEATGIGADGNVDNSGAITVTAIGGSVAGQNSFAYTNATGINSSGSMGPSLKIVEESPTEDVTSIVNTGAITVTATGATAEGQYSWVDARAVGIGSSDSKYRSDKIMLMTKPEAASDVINTGAITVTATGGTANGEESSADADAVGIYTSGNVSNSGALVVTAHGGTTTGEGSSADAAAVGIYVDGGSSLVNNSAEIIATATAEEGYESIAYGVGFLDGGSLTNTGVIRAFGETQAYEVAVFSGTVTLVDSYNLTLDGNPAVGSLYVAEEAELALNNATLSLTVLDGITRINTEYRIFATDEGGTVSGAFGSLAAPLNPDLVALYHDQATATSADDTVSVVYQPNASPQLETTGLLRHAVSLSADLVGQRLTTGFLQNQLAARAPRMYAAAHTVVSDAAIQYDATQAGSFFFTPYYANIDKDAAPVGYDADLVGFVTGLERQMGGSLCGFHLGFGHAAIDFTGNGFGSNQEDQELLSAGVHLMGNRKNWTWRGQVTGFYSWHDFEGLTGMNLEQRESADYDSYGVRTTLLAGHLFQRGGQMLLPEVGVEYLWLHRDSFTTDADNSVWDEHASSLDEHQVSALATLRWLTLMQAGEVEVMPSLAVGVRYLVTDDELDVRQSVAGSGPVTVKSEQDEVTGTVSASVRFRKDQLATEFAYGGEFSDDTTMHSAWLRFRYQF